ncbi:hypothetical protein ABNX05_18205 [Lysinibacillus sp. M3]|uniref:Phage tail protein n=1 Tax=Lysinibacillus zambalensis TaxID=3160866 RepID=A0ABV1MXD3_9BACI
MANAPIVSWYQTNNDKANEVKNTVNYGTVDADSESLQFTFYIWNNRGGTEDCSKMEEVVFTTRDREGGTGDTTGAIVEAVRDNWFNVRVDSLSESAFTPVGKGGVGTANPSGTKALGTTGTTTNPKGATATVWSAGASYVLGTYVRPTTANGYVYKVTQAGMTDSTQPIWTTVEGNTLIDGSIEYEVIRIEQTPATQEILGFANNTLDNGSNANLAGGNFCQVTVYADVPISASAGKNLLVQRVSYRYV